MNFQIRIFKDMETLSREAADIFVERAAESIAERGRFLAALNGGGTPNRLFQLLAADYREKIDWNRVHVFWGDERCVPPGDAGSSYGQAWDAFLSHVPIPESNIYRVRGELEPAEASRDYSLTLSGFASPPFEFPHFDLVYLGMGEDGHTASLFPGSPVEATAPVIAVTADYQGRPAGRVTLTPPVLNDSENTIFLVSGLNKADAVFNTFYTDDPLRYPAQRISMSTDPGPLWVLDRGAASRLDWRGHRLPG